MTWTLWLWLFDAVFIGTVCVVGGLLAWRTRDWFLAAIVTPLALFVIGGTVVAYLGI